MTDLDLLRCIRLHELQVALSCFPLPGSSAARVLEVGAGAGWQALHLQTLGYEVSAVDVEQSSYRPAMVFPVALYDGRVLPFPDCSFDVVFTSNVLEHILDIDAFLQETARVLRPGGSAIHVLPTPTWRFWSTLLYPLWFLKRALSICLGQQPAAAGASPPGSSLGAIFARAAANLLPRRHGERGNVWTELYYFSEAFWLRRFRSSGFVIGRRVPSGLFYTECSVLGAYMPLAVRETLARLLGSSCRTYQLLRASPGTGPSARLDDESRCAE